MKRSEYLEFHKKMCEQMQTICKAKNADYSGQSDKDDPFANFRVVEHVGICSAETGFLTRISDKLARIATYVKKGELLVKDESVTDTLCDLANYCILMAGYIEEKSVNAKLESLKTGGQKLPVDEVYPEAQKVAKKPRPVPTPTVGKRL